MEMGTRMRIIAGPCQHESLEQSQQIAEECQWVCDRYNIDYYFKASFDKANRTSIHSKRGVGIERTMEDFAKISAKTLTDVHETTQIDIVKDDKFELFANPIFHFLSKNNKIWLFGLVPAMKKIEKDANDSPLVCLEFLIVDVATKATFIN